MPLRKKALEGEHVGEAMEDGLGHYVRCSCKKFETARYTGEVTMWQMFRNLHLKEE